MTAVDVQKILNLKHAWEFILDRDVVASRSDYYMLSYIARLVNEGFFAEGGRIRGVPVTIGGSSYVPPLPNESDVKDKILEIIGKEDDAINIAIRLCLYCMKTQIFLRRDLSRGLSAKVTHYSKNSNSMRLFHS